MEAAISSNGGMGPPLEIKKPTMTRSKPKLTSKTTEPYLPHEEQRSGIREQEKTPVQKANLFKELCAS